ncbi:hypothetical protein [Bacillus thuringiensis]|uniref:hypothetical protein n=1 Tax=Bacillus thuringiensis TaxID=1428 RepID=UPI0021D69C40|nr:hypothetical protein [Bacillus thuringiensis]MCU7667954.1 hypothetical protein [Bacillus thuringiensis]
MENNNAEHSTQLITSEEQQVVNELLRKHLIDLSLEYKIEELFYKMTNDGWENHLVCPKKAAEYVYQEKQQERKNSFLTENFFSMHQESSSLLEEYIEDTTITDNFEEKKNTLHQLILLSKSLDKEMHEVMKKIYNDEHLINLLTFINDRTYRNASFYVEESLMKLALKDDRPYISELSLHEALEYFKLNEEQFFVEIKSSKKAKNA